MQFRSRSLRTSVASASVLALALVGCGDDGAEDTVDETVDETEDTADETVDETEDETDETEEEDDATS